MFIKNILRKFHKSEILIKLQIQRLCEIRASLKCVEMNSETIIRLRGRALHLIKFPVSVISHPKISNPFTINKLRAF